jgi:hypothetical protein
VNPVLLGAEKDYVVHRSHMHALSVRRVSVPQMWR